MRVEKRATNKVGIIILAIAVIGLIAGGSYYLITHKGNLDLSIRLPWQKDETKEIDNASNNKSGQKGNENRSFRAPIGIDEVSLKNTICVTTMTKVEDKPKEFILHYSTTNVQTKSSTKLTRPCKIEFYKIAADGFLVPGESKLDLSGDTRTEEGKIVIKKSDLEANELYGIQKVTLFYKITDLKDNTELPFVDDVTLINDYSVKNDLQGVLINEFNNIRVYYYKTISDHENNYIYFIFENKNEVGNAKIRIKKLLVNDLLMDTKDFEKDVLVQTKTLTYVVVPKKKVPVISKFNISFFSIMQTDDGEDSYYISGEYAREL